jgi:putative FmdB family regulatory protein
MVPTYSYACTECDNRFDIQQTFTEDALTQCPQCSARLRKLFGNVGVVFKGSGFYRTDARREAGTGSGSTKAATADVKGGGSSGDGGSSSTSSSSSSEGGSGAASTTAAPATSTSSPAKAASTTT